MRQAVRHLDIHTIKKSIVELSHIQTGRLTVRSMDRHIEKLTDRRTNGWAGKQADRSTDGKTGTYRHIQDTGYIKIEIWTVGWTNRKTNRHTDSQSKI